MTAKTSQHLADALHGAGFHELAKRAEADEFHDFLSEHAFPNLLLDELLVSLINDNARPAVQRAAAYHIRMRLHEGEFDASKEEGDEWAASDEGQEAYAELAKAMKQ